jgi:hypothetical protein
VIEQQPGEVVVIPQADWLRHYATAAIGFENHRDRREPVALRVRIALPDGMEQVFGLVFELIEVGTDANVTIDHDGPPWW